jgi:hypothetical protein
MRVSASEFAKERSHDTARAANENSRPMAQYALLINGAAASAIIAFLSKEKVGPEVLAMAPWSLITYAVGVVAGVFGMFCMTESLDCFSHAWRYRAEGIKGDDRQKLLGDRWWWAVRGAVFVSTVCFVSGSIIFAYGLLNRMPMLFGPCE